MSGGPKVDVAQIPDFIREELAAITLECVRNSLSESERGCEDD